MPSLRQLSFAGAQCVLGALPVFDVVTRPIPSDYLAGLVSQRHAGHIIPAILTICAQHALFGLERFSGHPVSTPEAINPVAIIGMDKIAYVLDRKIPANILLGRLVGEISLAVLVGDDNHRRDRIDRPLQVLPRFQQGRFAPPQRILCPLAVFNVVGRRIPGDHLSVFTAQRHAPSGKPAVFAIGSSQPRFRLERFACRQGVIPGLFNARNIVGMGYDAGAPRPVRRCESAVAAPDLIDKIDDTVGAMAKHQYWHRVDGRLQFPHRLLLLIAHAPEQGRRPTARRAQQHHKEGRDGKQRKQRQNGQCRCKQGWAGPTRPRHKHDRTEKQRDRRICPQRAIERNIRDNGRSHRQNRNRVAGEPGRREPP